MLLHRLTILGQEGPANAREESVEGAVRAVDPNLLPVCVQKMVPFGLRIVRDRFVGIEEPGLGEHAHRPAAGFVPGNRDGAVIERSRLVDQDRKSTRLNSSHVSISYAV